MKVGIKNKSELKYINVEDLMVGKITLKELANIVNKQNDIIESLLNELKDKHIVNKDTKYIIKLQDKLVEIDKLEIVAVEKLKYPLRFYDLENGELKLNKKVVAAI